MPPTKNPLRYPGAKRELVPYVTEILESESMRGCRYYEPFAGSGAVGLELLQKGYISDLVLLEKDVMIFAFWYCAFFRTEELCKKILDTDITINLWREMLHLRDYVVPDMDRILDLGYAGLFYNRTNFSGILHANPIGGLTQSSSYQLDCRFNKDKIVRLIRELAGYSKHVTVEFGDALLYLKNHKNDFAREHAFIYIDPPYYVKGKQLYRCHFNELQHIRLAEIVKALRCCVWLLSYDNDPFVQRLYPVSDGFTQHGYYLDYSVRTTRKNQGENELLISNMPIPPVKLKSVAIK